MIRTLFSLAPVALALAGCGTTPAAEAPSRADFSAELIDLKGKDGPPKGPEEACWQTDIRPAVIETTTEQQLVQPESVAKDGTRIPAVVATETRQRIVQDRGTVWFRTPCPADLTPETVATVQRALKARGLYLLPLTGVMDDATRAAIRKFQRPRGIDSDHLSLAAARDLGIVATELKDL